MMSANGKTSSANGKTSPNDKTRSRELDPSLENLVDKAIVEAGQCGLYPYEARADSLVGGDPSVTGSQVVRIVAIRIDRKDQREYAVFFFPLTGISGVRYVDEIGKSVNHDVGCDSSDYESEDSFGCDIRTSKDNNDFIDIFRNDSDRYDSDRYDCHDHTLNVQPRWGNCH